MVPASTSAAAQGIRKRCNRSDHPWSTLLGVRKGSSALSLIGQKSKITYEDLPGEQCAHTRGERPFSGGDVSVYLTMTGDNDTHEVVDPIHPADLRVSRSLV